MEGFYGAEDKNLTYKPGSPLAIAGGLKVHLTF